MEARRPWRRKRGWARTRRRRWRRWEWRRRRLGRRRRRVRRRWRGRGRRRRRRKFVPRWVRRGRRQWSHRRQRRRGNATWVLRRGPSGVDHVPCRGRARRRGRVEVLVINVEEVRRTTVLQVPVVHDHVLLHEAHGGDVGNTHGLVDGTCVDWRCGILAHHVQVDKVQASHPQLQRRRVDAASARQ